MKKILFTGILSTILFWGIILGQAQAGNGSFCVHKTNQPYLSSSNYTHHIKNGSGDFCVRVYLHKIIRNGFPAISDTEVLDDLNSLNDYFHTNGNSGIDFFLSETNPITTHSYESIPGIENLITTNGSCLDSDFNVLSNFTHNDGIDIFFLNYEEEASAANGIANVPEMVMTYSHLGTAAIAHEMGHVLGLFHTFHGTIGNGGIGNCENDDGYGLHDPECVGGNGNYGDFVQDTPPDAGDFNTSYTPPCDPSSGDLLDHCENQLLYPDPNTRNYMRPSGYEDIGPILVTECWDHFTPLQFTRMKFFLKDHYGAIRVECPPPACETCEEAMIFADNIFDFMTYANDCSSATISLPILYPANCGYDFVVSWNGGANSGTPSGGTPFLMNFNSPSNSSVLITVFLDGVQVCEPFQRTCTIGSCTCEVTGVDFTLSFREGHCVYKFKGLHNATPCLEPNYFWEIKDILENTIITNNHLEFHYTFPGSGIYEVCFTAAYGTIDPPTCGERVCKTISVTCSDSGSGRANEDAKQLSIVPNPAKADQELFFYGINFEEVTNIEVIDIKGNIKLSFKPEDNSFARGQLSAGSYFVRFTTKDDILIKRLIIQ